MNGSPQIPIDTQEDQSNRMMTGINGSTTTAAKESSSSEEEAHQNQQQEKMTLMEEAEEPLAKSSDAPPCSSMHNKMTFMMSPPASTITRSSQIPRLLPSSSSSAPRPQRLSLLASPTLLAAAPPMMMSISSTIATVSTPASAVSNRAAISRKQAPSTTTNSHNNKATTTTTSSTAGSMIPCTNTISMMSFQNEKTVAEMMTTPKSTTGSNNNTLAVNNNSSNFRKTESTLMRNNNSTRTSFLSPTFDDAADDDGGGTGRGKSQVRVVARIRPLLPAERAYSKMSIHPYHHPVDEEYSSQGCSPLSATFGFSPSTSPAAASSSSSGGGPSSSSNHSERENRGFANTNDDTDNSSSRRAALGSLQEKSNNSATSTTADIMNMIPSSDAMAATTADQTKTTTTSNGCSSPQRRSLMQPPSPTRRKTVVQSMTSNNNNNDVAAATCKTPTCENSSRRQDKRCSSNNSNNNLPRSLIATTSTCHVSTSAATAVDRRFDFDVVFPTTCTQEHVYEHAVGDAIRRNILRGYNTTILAYGQTGSGKTYTMGGSTASALCNNNNSDNKQTSRTARTTADEGGGLRDDDGIIPRAIADLFQARNDYKHMGKFSIELTCLEIYNDELRDLLVDNQGVSLKLRDHGDQDGVEVRGLQSVQITSVQQALEYMHNATLRRTTAVTAMNERSSRSHAICTLSVSIQPHNKKAYAAERIRAKLTLVDLAGSERIKETGVMGLQQQESININKDLFVLGKVVATLSEKSKRDQALSTNPFDERFNARKEPRRFHVPYRDCKLTRLLRDSLGGNCCTVLVACVSPAEVHVEESLNTLRYAERSRSITNSIRKNVIPSALASDEVTKLRAENKKYKVLLSQLKRRLMVLQLQLRLPPSPQHKSNNNDTSSSTSASASLCAELSGLQTKLEQAEEEARAAKEHSHSVIMTADRWKQQLEQMKRNSLKTPTSQVSLPFEPANNEDSTTDDTSCTSVSSLKLLTHAVPAEETEAENLVVGDAVNDEKDMQGEIESLVDQKFDLADQLADLRDLIESKRVDLEEMEDEFSSRQSELLAVITKQQQVRDQLDKQVAQMKLQLHLLASNLNERVNSINNKDIKRSSGGGGGKFSAILRTLSSDAALAMNVEEGSEVEMQTLRGINDTSKAKLEALLQEERAKCLQKQHENEAVLQRLERLQAENALLLQKSQTAAAAVDEAESSRHRVIAHDETQGRDEVEGDTTERMDEIPSAESGRNLLQWTADYGRANINRRNSSNSVCSSFASSDGTELRPSTMDCEDGGQVLISNLDQVERVPGCMCTRAPSTFSTNPQHVEFYLPKLRLTCSYCRPKDPSAQSSNEQEEELGDDPLALSNILRDWQVQFLNSMGIDHAMALVQANARQSGVLAKHMRRWRRKQKLQSIKTKSCWLALHIWARTCQIVVTAIQTRRAGVMPGASKQFLPSFLEVPFDSDDRSVSTLGGDTSVRCYLVKDRES